MSKLRRALLLYYADAGRDDPLVITIPKGTYVPCFQRSGKPPQVSSVPNPPAPRAELHPVIAVLPFDNLSPDMDDAFLAAGITEELVVILTNMPALSVASRHASAHFEGAPYDLAAIGRTLQVRFLLEGSVRRCGRRVRITAQIHDASAGIQLWAERYDRDLNTGNLLEIQSDIARQVTAQTADMYTGAISRSLMYELGRTSGSDFQVHEALLRYYHWLGQHTDTSYAATRKALERAISIEPDNPPLMGMLADILRAGYSQGFTDEPNPLSTVLELAQRAVALAPEHPLCRVALCYALLQARRKAELLEVAEPLLSDTDASPSYVADAAVAVACSGEWERGCAVLEEQLRRMKVVTHFFLYPFCLAAYRRGDYEHALAITNRFVPTGLYWRPMLRAAVLGQLGRRREAEEVVREMLRLRPDFPSKGRRFMACFLLEDRLVDKLLEGLYKAGLPAVQADP